MCGICGEYLHHNAAVFAASGAVQGQQTQL